MPKHTVPRLPVSIVIVSRLHTNNRIALDSGLRSQSHTLASKANAHSDMQPIIDGDATFEARYISVATSNQWRQGAEGYMHSQLGVDTTRQCPVIQALPSFSIVHGWHWCFRKHYPLSHNPRSYSSGPKPILEQPTEFNRLGKRTSFASESVYSPRINLG